MSVRRQPLVSRRTALKLGAAGAALPLVHVRTAYAAGRLKLAFMDSWVPTENAVMQKLVSEWGAKNKVDVTLDLLSYGTANSKLPLAQAEEALAGSGHDVMMFITWHVWQYHEHLEPIDDVVNELTKRYGELDPLTGYLGKVGGRWFGLPTSYSSHYNNSEARLSWFSKWGFDLQKWYPNKPSTPEAAKAWTYDLLAKLSGKAKEAGEPFALGLGLTGDSVDWTGALLRAYGGALVNEKGDITVRSDAVREALEYVARIYENLPADASAFDDASNNKALIADRSALIFNPPSAWWVARRDAMKVAEDCWQFPSPLGPAGRYNPYRPGFWGIWSFSPNKSAAKDLITWLQERPQVETLCTSSAGFDIPTFLSMHDFPIWSEEKPPHGVLYNYPGRPWHDAVSNIAGYPAPPHIGTQIYNKATFPVMCVKLAKNREKMKDVLDWAESEIASYVNM